MTEQQVPPSPTKAVAAALAVALALVVLAGLGGALTALLLWLAQPLLALAISWQRGTREQPTSVRMLMTQLPPLLTLWAMALLLLALLLVWPMTALRASGSLSATLALCVAVSIALLGLWRIWPLWTGLQRHGGSLRAHWQALAKLELSSWRGLGAAVLVLLICLSCLALSWPGLLPAALRWPLAIAAAVLQPLAHLLLQRIVAIEYAPAARPVQAQDLLGEAAALHPLEPLAHHQLVPQLYAAARAGRVDRALQLLEAGADVHAAPLPESRDQRTLVVLAAVLPDLRLLRELIARGVNVNQPYRGITPLLAATRDSWHGRPDAVMTLLANGADPRVTDADGNTPLHHAARSSDPGVAALLRDAAAELDALNRDGLSPLAMACQVGNWRLAKFLLERGASAEPRDGSPALLAAAATDEDDPSGVQLLLKHKARIDARDRERRSALHTAALAGNADIVQALLAAGANLEARDLQARTPWLEAARNAHAVVLEQLLACHVDVHVVDGEGRNAVLLACAADNVTAELIARLLQLGIPADQADHAGRRAVDVAAAAGRWAVVAQLDADYPLPSAVSGGVEETDGGTRVLPDRPPLELLGEGLQQRRYDGLEALARLCTAEEMGTLLHDPQLALNPAALDWLLSHAASAEVANANGDLPIFALFDRGVEALESIKVLLRHAVSPAGAGGLGRLLAACVRQESASRGLEQFVLELLDRGADPFAASPGGDPPLALAVRLGWLRVQQWLLEHGVDREARDSHGMTALHLAAALGREASLKLLIVQGASPDARAADGQTPLGVALSIGRRDLADWLDWRIWPLPRRTLRAHDLPAAAICGDTDAVRRLLDLGISVEAVDAQGCTALLRAAGGGHAATLELLLARGADPQCAATGGATPLSAAVSVRQPTIVAMLLQAGAPIEQRLPGGVTVLMLACALGLPEISARLLAAGADIHAVDAQQLTALHYAVQYGFAADNRSRLIALLDTLLLNGANPEAAENGKPTPLLLMLGARAQPGSKCDEQVVLAGVERLLDEQVSLDVQDPRGFGPLHLAALHGLSLLVQRLLRGGADPECRDTLNRTPREIAIMRGFIDVAGQFQPAQPGVTSMARFLRDSQ
jgi:ankyrin repeat protein